MFMKKILLLCFTILFLVACGDKEKAFKEGAWGMTMEEVIKNEKDIGNELYTEDISDNEVTIEYKDILINGHLADVQYVFNNQVSKYSLEFSIISLDKKDIEKFYNLPDEIKFNDFILTEGHYFFRDIDEEDSKEIYNSLVSKYGEPNEATKGYVNWNTETTSIYFDEEDYLSYAATIKALDDFMKLNKSSNTKNNDL